MAHPAAFAIFVQSLESQFELLRSTAERQAGEIIDDLLAAGFDIQPVVRPPTESRPTAPDDVLGRLKEAEKAIRGANEDQRTTIPVGLLRDAVAEIERLRHIVAGMPPHEPAPAAERWTVFSSAIGGMEGAWTEAEPFGVDNGRIWFRRRVPT
jgi:hypothetical protein